MLCRVPALPGCWPSALAERRFPVTAARCPLAHRAPRIRQGYQYTDRSRGVKSEELGAIDRSNLFPSAIGRIRAFANDTRISLSTHFPITKATNNEDNKGAIQEFFTRYGDDRPAIGEDDGMKIMDVIHGDKDAHTTVDFSDCKQDMREVTYGHQDVRGQSATEVSDDEEYSSWPAEDLICYHSDDVRCAPQIPLSSHRDGAINKGRFHWKEEFHIANRNENK